MSTKLYNDNQFNEVVLNQAGTTAPPPPPSAGGLSLYVDAVDWTSRTVWQDFQFTFRQGVGVAATFAIDTTGVVGSAPTCDSTFVLTMPTGEKFVLVAVGEPKTLYRRDADGVTIDTVHTYEAIDLVSALDRVPIPAQQFIESTSGEIIATIIGQLNSAINTSGIAVGNNVPYLDTADFVKFSDIARHQGVAAGGYTVQIDPKTNGGYAAIANFKTNFSASGITVDKDSTEDFTPTKDEIEPDNTIINLQRVKGTKPGPHHTVCEFRELDALNPSFKLKSKPYGIEGTELINFQIDGGSVSGADASGLPNIVPIHYPVQVEIADITLGGSGEICGFIGRGGVTVLSAVLSTGSIGAKVGGASYSQSVPFAAGAPAPDLNNQYYYDWYAAFSSGGLEVRAIENYLNANADTTRFATVTSIDLTTNTVGLTVNLGTLADLPKSIRFFNPLDSGDVRGFCTITSRSGGSIIVDNIPTTLAVGDYLAYTDSASVIVTEKVIYSGSAPSNRYGKPQLIISGGSGITARQWTASYGPAISAVLLDNPYTGVPGRRLRVDTLASKSSDMVVAASGNTAVCTFVGDRLPLEGVIRLILNYDAAKIVDVTVQNVPAQARCGIRQGDIIESEAVLTEADATALGQAVLDEFADPKPKGTITRESALTTAFPCPNYTAAIDLPSEYGITATSVPISDISVDFGGYDPELNDGVLIYQISLGNLDIKDAVERQLLANQTSLGLEFRPLSASGARISSATWNDVDTVSLGISGSITLNGKAASSSFNPADYATGNLREAPVALAGTTSASGVTGELMVEVIYPPLDIDAATETCNYSPRTNTITYRWGRPPGAFEYHIQRKIDDGTGNYVYKFLDTIFNEQYPLPYEPASKSIKVLTVGLGGKEGAGGFIELTCSLPQLPAPNPFQIAPNKAVKPSGRIPLLVGAPPTGQYLNRAESMVVLLTKTPANIPPTVRADFPSSDANLIRTEFPMQGITTATRQVCYYEEFEPGEMVWATAFFKDRFGDEGAITVPFDVLHPPVTPGHIDLADFFQSASQANGGAVEDDNETTPQVDFTGKYRIHLGNHNSGINLWMDESAAIINGGAYDPDSQIPSHVYDITDTDVVNGYADVIMKQKFRWTKKKQRKYRPNTITFIGPNIRTRDDSGGNPHNTHEKRFLVGYVGTPPAIVPHQIDAVFDKTLFEFRPGINGLGNTFTTVTGVVMHPKPEALKVRWDRAADDASVRRYLVLIHTAPFGTKGPGQDTAIADELNLIQTDGTITVYNQANTLRNTTVSVIDAGDTGRHLFQNGDTVGAITITPGVAYYAAVVAQLYNGRYSVDFSAVVDSLPGGASGGEDTADAGPVVNVSMLPWRPKKGWRVIWQPPTTNFTAPRGYVISYYITVSGTTYWMNPDTGAVLAQVAGSATADERNTANTGGVQVYIRVDDTRHTTGIAIADAELDPVFVTNGVKARVRAANRQAAGVVISANSQETGVVIPTSDSNIAQPGALLFPSAPSAADNTTDGDPDKNEARVDITLATQNSQSFASNNIGRIEIVYTRTAAGVPTGVPGSLPVAIPEAVLSTASYKHSFYFPLGRNFRITEVIAWNGDRHTNTPGTLNFVAGNVLSVDPADAQIVPTPVFGSITREDGSNKIDLVPVTLSQTGGVIVWFKKLVLEVRVNGGTWAIEDQIGLKAEDALHASTSGSYSKTFRVKRKAGVTAEYRMLAYAVGGKASGNPPGTFTIGVNQVAVGATGSDLSIDTGPPNNGNPLTLNFAKFKKNGLIVMFTMPTLQMVTHTKTVLILHDNGESTSNPGVRMYFHPVLAQWVSANTLPNNEIEFGKGGIPSLPLTKSEVYVGGRTNLYVRVGVYNQASGTNSTYSPDVGQAGFIGPVTQSNAENTAPSDNTVPDPPPAPIIKEQYGSVIVKAKAPAVGGTLVNKWQMAITDINTAPSSADPPQGPFGGTVFAYEEGADGIHKWRVPYSTVLPNTRYFWARCKNANNPTTGGPGNNGWSDWSNSASLTLNSVTRPLQDEIGAGPPLFATAPLGNAIAYLDVGGTTQSGLCPLNTYDDGADIIYEFLLPTDSRAYSLTTIQWERYRIGGTLAESGSLSPSTTAILRLPLRSAVRTFRYRIRNKYRIGGSSGWSYWMRDGENIYAKHLGTTGAPLNNYDPQINPQVESDYLAETSYPSRYTTP